MSDADRIERLETVLGTLITWLVKDLGVDGVDQLLFMLTSEPENTSDTQEQSQ